MFVNLINLAEFWKESRTSALLYVYGICFTTYRTLVTNTPSGNFVSCGSNDEGCHFSRCPCAGSSARSA